MFTRRYWKMWGAAIGGVIAAGLVSYAGIDPEAYTGRWESVMGIVNPLIAILGGAFGAAVAPKNAEMVP